VDDAGLIVFWLVAGARFFVPLSIPRYPLPGILASLVLDAVDQTIFQQFPSLDLSSYQGYDKVLDIYYLSIAYVSTMRNWKNQFAFQVSRFLFYWRLLGVTLFELTQLRPLLLIFPNTFEYFFIFYEAYRLRWDPEKMSNKVVVGAAAFIWIVVKLPQEYWIHIGQIDTTDWIKSGLFGVGVDTPWGEIMKTWPGVFLLGIVLIGVIVFGIWWLVQHRLPPADRKPAFNADAHHRNYSSEEVGRAVEFEAKQIIDTAFFEKMVLVTLISLSFAQVLVGVQANDLELVAAVVFVVLVNTVLSHWLARRGFGLAFTMQTFFILLGVNSFLMLVYSALQSTFGGLVLSTNALFYVVLFSLLITMFDRYRQVYLMRFTMRELPPKEQDLQVQDDSVDTN
jgi:hypothetical protein